MKKNLLALLLAMMLLLSLTACGKKEEAPVETPDVETEEVAPEVADPDVGVPAEPTEEPDTPAVMPEVEVAPGEVEIPAVKPEEKPVPEQKPEEAPAEKPAAGQSVDLNAFYTSLVDTYGENFPANMDLCEMPEMLDGFFPGLSDIGTNQMMIYQPMMGAVVCEIALIEVADAANVDAVKNILQARIDAQVEGGAWYPESIEGWKNSSRIAVNGNYVMMIAYSECDAVVDAFNALFA